MAIGQNGMPKQYIKNGKRSLPFRLLTNLLSTKPKKNTVIPAKAGIQNANKNNKLDLWLDSRFAETALRLFSRE